MKENDDKRDMMYGKIPAVARLNKVPGFDPLQFLRPVVSEKTQEKLLKLDLRYQKLWFRLAHPQGRMKLTALRITDQMAIFEAKVFLDRSDAEPISSFIASLTREDTPDYIREAQETALNTALSDAGFGLQFADVNVGAEGEHCGSAVPVTNGQADVMPHKEEKEISKESIGPVAQSEPESLPVTPTPEEAKTAEPLTENKTVFFARPAVVSTAMSQAPANSDKEQEGTLPADMPAPAQEQRAEPSDAHTRYTADMAVDDIAALMTLEEARGVKVDMGICNGWTIGQVADERTPSLKYYLYGYKGNNNILRAAAKVMLDSLTEQKAG